MSDEQAFNNWIVIRDPGCVPDVKGPFRPVQVAPFLREVFECRPYSFVEVLTVTYGGIVSVQDGPECLEMTDGRSAPIARKHRARLSASLLDGLGQTKSADCGHKPEQFGQTLSRAAEFVSWAMREGPWEGGSLDGDVLQDKAQSLGLIIETPYDPAAHGDNNCDAEPGDSWFVLHPDIAAAASGLSTDATVSRSPSLHREPLLNPQNFPPESGER